MRRGVLLAITLLGPFSLALAAAAQDAARVNAPGADAPPNAAGGGEAEMAAPPPQTLRSGAAVSAGDGVPTNGGQSAAGQQTITTAPGTSAYIPQTPGEAAPPHIHPVPVPQSRIGIEDGQATTPRAAGNGAGIVPESMPADADGAVKRFSMSQDRFTQEGGEALYRTTCQACHMSDGKGAVGAGGYPPLDGNPKLVSKYYIVDVLLNGYHGMPRFGDQMTDDQVAAIANYVRSELGSNAFEGTLTSDDVNGLRER